MSLLVDMTAAALDPAYADAAERRQREPGRRRPVWVAGLGLLVALGLVTGVATAQVRRSAASAGSVRAGLLADVRSQTAETDRLAARLDQLRAQVATARDTGLGDDTRGRALAAQVAALELATGQTRVTGAGLEVTLDDAPAADADSTSERGGQLGDGRVYDRDVQDVVNALWAAGAEAVSINGQRITTLTAIRSAGEAVLVDFRPLTPPYRLSAIGDVDAMEPAFVDSATARRFTTYTSLYGLGFRVQRADDLTLPAAAPLELHVARSDGSTQKPARQPTPPIPSGAAS